jgi:hypothetical protein
VITGIVIGALTLGSAIAGLWKTKRARRAAKVMDLAARAAQNIPKR